jgi:hypothetical protein
MGAEAKGTPPLPHNRPVVGEFTVVRLPRVTAVGCCRSEDASESITRGLADLRGVGKTVNSVTLGSAPSKPTVARHEFHPDSPFHIW